MAWVVDISVLLDIANNDARFASASTGCLTRHLPEGLIICPVSYVELAPAFVGQSAPQQTFLRALGVDWQELWTWQDTETAQRLWDARVAQKRAGLIPKRPLADVLIEAFASRFQGLITRNPRHFPTVPVVVPS